MLFILVLGCLLIYAGLFDSGTSTPETHHENCEHEHEEVTTASPLVTAPETRDYSKIVLDRPELVLKVPAKSALKVPTEPVGYDRTSYRYVLANLSDRAIAAMEAHPEWICERYTVEQRVFIEDAVDRNNLAPKLAPILFGIGLAEGLNAPREFGIMTPDGRKDEDVVGFYNQSGWCASTVAKNWVRWSAQHWNETPTAGSVNRQVISSSFLEFLRDRYAPLNAENDPTNLNDNWLCNVRSFYARWPQIH